MYNVFMNIDSLPPEILLHIIKYLPEGRPAAGFDCLHLELARRTCKLWKETVDDPVYVDLYKRQFSEDIPKNLTSGRELYYVAKHKLDASIGLSNKFVQAIGNNWDKQLGFLIRTPKFNPN